MKRWLTLAQWNPYLAGACVGILAVLSVLITSLVLDKGQYLGASTTFVRASGLIEQVVSPDHVAANSYFQKEKIKVDWQMLFVVGVFGGALLSARLGRTARPEWVPPVWRERFGPSPLRRAVGAFIGGFILLFGARLAGGCPSGHGMSGNMQLAVSSLLALVFFILGAVLAARQIYPPGDH
ncbi:MAG: YeeE/YedE thiosulfate transporter family protein [Desulfuromonas thiophila]|jgi:uncharacterized membrane protein YedE/YeeE|nr:YeeE/YedE family protein [Desulfuromonas thiophila]MDY0397238.1 YeeE/YedE thiosulfate transporter family protein [Desulfuromonas thiophila]